MGSNRGGHDQGGRGRGRGFHKCTYCHGENHTVDFYWKLSGKPSAHQASLQVEEPTSQSFPPTSRVVSIPEEEYNHLLSIHSNPVGFGSIAILAQQGTSTACLATQDLWVIDLSATDHMTSTSSLLSDLEHSSILPNVTLADGLATLVSGLGVANLTPNLSLSSILYIPNFPFNVVN